MYSDSILECLAIFQNFPGGYAPRLPSLLHILIVANSYNDSYDPMCYRFPDSL